MSENESRSIDLEEFFDVLKLGLEHSGMVRDPDTLKPTQQELTQMHKEFIENDYSLQPDKITHKEDLDFF